MSVLRKTNINLCFSHIDHFVLVVEDIEKSAAFYQNVLGMTLIRFGDNRVAVRCGHQKINFHQDDTFAKPKAVNPCVGSADFCLITATPISDVINYLSTQGIDVELGPVRRTGANRPLDSIYIRDLDANLIEIANEIIEDR